jgi:hypothetical protein
LLSASVDLAVVTATIEGIILAIRTAHVAVELLNGFPSVPSVRFGYGVAGLWNLGLLMVTGCVAFVVCRDPRIITALFCCAAMASVWGSLLSPTLRPEPSGGFEQSGVTLVMLALLAILIAIVGGVAHHMAAPSGAANESTQERTRRSLLPPGLSTSVVVVATLLVVLICFHLAVPIASNRTDYRRGAPALVGSAVIASWGCFKLLEREWHVAVAELAFALASLALCSAAAGVVPTRPGLLAAQYPMLFNAMIVGLAGAAAIWTRYVIEWQGATAVTPARRSHLRLVPVAKRMAFLSAALALLIGVVMAVWPRWPAIATMDHSIGRVTAGFSANLFLLLVLLWCSRHIRRPTFHVLTVLSVFVTVGFLLVRVIPFTPMFG